MDGQAGHVTHRHLRTPRAAAIAGIVFAVIFATSYWLIYQQAPGDTADFTAWLAAHGETVTWGVSLLPFAGIAFLWAARQQLGLLPPIEAAPKAREALSRALAADSMASYVQDVAAAIRAWVNWDWPGAEASFRRAIETLAIEADSELNLVVETCPHCNRPYLAPAGGRFRHHCSQRGYVSRC